jgi:hypothetical protein
VEIPYEAPTNWLSTDIAAGNSSAGMIGLQLINKLSSCDPTGTVTPIYIQVFVNASDDFQFSCPVNRALTTDPSGNTHKWSPDLKAQGEEIGPCELPASSSECLRLQKAILLGDINAKCRKFHDTQSFVYTSLKQLCNMLTPIERFSSATTDTKSISGRRYTPYGTGWTSRAYDDDFWIAPLHCIIPMYRFMRGSYRAHVMVNDKVQASAWLTRGDADLDAYAANNQCIMNGSSTDSTNTDLRYGSFGFAFFYDNSVYPVDVVVPYFSAVSCNLTLNGTFMTARTATFRIGLSTQKTAKNMIFCVAGGDDFMLGCRMSIPRIRTAAASLRVEPSTLNPLAGHHMLPSGGVTYVTCQIDDRHGTLYYRYDAGWHPVSHVDAVTFEYVETDDDYGMWLEKGNIKMDAFWKKELNKLKPERLPEKPQSRPKRSYLDRLLRNQNTETDSDSQ